MPQYREKSPLRLQKRLVLPLDFSPFITFFGFSVDFSPFFTLNQEK